MPDETLDFEAGDPGDPRVAEELLPLVYDELRRLAALALAREGPGNSLPPTGLVHEAYLRLAKAGEKRLWDNPGHYFSAAAEAMRRILIERARARNCEKRGGGHVRREIDPTELAAPEVHEDLLALDEALRRLEQLQPRLANVVKLRYFAGLTVAETAKTIGVSPRTANADWAYARAWLLAELSECGQSPTVEPRGND